MPRRRRPLGSRGSLSPCGRRRGKRVRRDDREALHSRRLVGTWTEDVGMILDGRPMIRKLYLYEDASGFRSLHAIDEFRDDAD